MKKIITILMILLLLVGCGSNNSDSPATKANPFGNKVFTKEDIQKKLDEGLSDSWQNYQISAVLQYYEFLPSNVLESFKNAIGEYAYDNLEIEPAFLHGGLTTNIKSGEMEDKFHAILDLYNVTPNSVVSALTISKEELEKKVSENQIIDVSQYKTYEDGLDYWPYHSYFGFETLEENELVKIEGVRDITVGTYEDIARYVRVTNVSDTPIYIDDYFLDKNVNQEITDKINWPSIEGYEAEYDKIELLTNDTAVLSTSGKDVLLPGEQTNIGITYSKHQNFNSHWYLKIYSITEAEYSDWNNVKFIQSIEHEAEIGLRKEEDVVLIMKNRTVKEEFEYATVKGTLYNTDGEPLAFMPFTLTYVDVESKNSGNFVESRQHVTSFDGSFEFKLPVVLYKTDNTYARYTISVNGGKAILDGKFCTVVIDDKYCLDDGPLQDGYAEAVKRNGRRYGQKTYYGQITEAAEYNCTIVVPDAYEYLVYNIASEEDYGGQANYYDYGNGILATVKFHDDESNANETAYLNVFDTDGKLLFRKHLGVQNTMVEVSDDGSLICAAITPKNRVKGNEAADNDSTAAPPDSITTIFDINGNVVFEYEPHSFNRGARISHDNKLLAMEVEQCTFGIIDIATKQILWKDYRGNQIRQIIFSEDDSVVYMGSQERIIAYRVSDGTKLWETDIFSFPIDMIASSKYIYASSKTTGGNDNKLACINRETGKMEWTYQVGSRGTKLTISPDETLLYWGNDTGARDNSMYMLDAKTGQPLWSVGGCNQAAWFTSDSQYVAMKGYGLVEVYDRDGNKVATSAVGSNARMSWFVYVKDDLSTLLDIAGGGGMGNSGWLYTLKLNDGYSKEFIDKQREAK